MAPKLKSPLISINTEEIRLLQICSVKRTKSGQLHIILPNIFNWFLRAFIFFLYKSISLITKLPKHYHITENYRLISQKLYTKLYKQRKWPHWTSVHCGHWDSICGDCVVLCCPSHSEAMSGTLIEPEVTHQGRDPGFYATLLNKHQPLAWCDQEPRYNISIVQWKLGFSSSLSDQGSWTGEGKHQTLLWWEKN